MENKTPGQVARNTYFRNASWENITKEAREEWEQVAAAVLAHARQDKRTMLAYTEFHVICKCPKCETERQGREQRARKLLDAMTDEERNELFGNYCRSCGSKDTKCQCWNDE